MRLGFGALSILMLAHPLPAFGQASWATGAYEPRPVAASHPPAPPPPPVDRHPPDVRRGQWEGQWQGRWVTPPPLPAEPYGYNYIPAPAYRDTGRVVTDGPTMISNNASANVVIQSAPMTMTTTETIMEYVVDDRPRYVRRAVPKRRIAKRPHCVCHLVYR